MGFNRLTLSAILTCLLVLMASKDVHAQDRYLRGGLDFNGDEDAQAATLSVRYGQLLMTPKWQNLKLYGELRAAIGITEGSTKISAINMDVKIKNLVGAYASLRNHIGGTNLTPYIVLGYAHVSFKGSALGTATASDSDVSFGGGIDWELNEKWTLNIDGTRYIKNSHGDMIGISIGVSRWFR